MVVDGRPCSAPVTVSSGNVVRLGTTDLLIGRPSDAPQPRWAPTGAADLLTDPPPQPIFWPRPTAAVMATVITAMLTAAFRASHVEHAAQVSAAAAVIAATTWAVLATRRFRRVRADRRQAATVESDRRAAAHRTHAAAHRAHLHRHPPLATLLADIDATTDRVLRQLGPTAGDTPVIAIGVGPPSWVVGGLTTSPDPRTNVAISWTLQAGTVTRVVGDRRVCLSLVRAVLIQLAIVSNPSEWTIAIESDTCSDWEWAEWLPHARRSDGRFAVGPMSTMCLAPREHRRSAKTLLILDSTNDEPIVDAAASSRLAVIVISEGDRAARSDHRSTLSVGTTGSARWVDGELAAPFAITGLGATRAADLARRLALRVEAEPHAARHPSDESPSNHRGPAPNREAESSAL